MRNTFAILGSLLAAGALSTALSLPARAGVIADIGGFLDVGVIPDGNGGNALLFGIDPTVDQGIGNSKVFLTIDGTGAGGPEKGYNTTGTVEFETTASGTTELLLSEVPLVNLAGTLYRAFGFALNAQAGAAGTVSLDEIQLFQAATASLDSYNVGGGSSGNLTGASKIFEWSGLLAGDYIKVTNYVPGISDIEMTLLVNANIFNADPYVYLFGNNGHNIAADGGGDKWVVSDQICELIGQQDCSHVPVPAPATPLLLIVGLLAVRGTRKLTRTN